MKIVFATGNPHKLEEIKEITKSFGITDIDFVIPDAAFNPVENGKTFEENSYIKAKEANRLTNLMSLADDSGLCCEGLDGAPGIYSARYADTPRSRIDKLLQELKHNNNRKAEFVCAMTLLDKQGNVLITARGECPGEIAHEQSGSNGFGYDPVFIVENTNKTMADMTEEEKNKISHRSHALRKILQYIKSEMNQK